MPIYEFKCLDCEKEFEAVLFKSDEQIPCPHCQGNKLKRLMSACALKSSGEFTPATGGASSCASCSSSNCGSCH